MVFNSKLGSIIRNQLKGMILVSLPRKRYLQESHGWWKEKLGKVSKIKYNVKYFPAPDTWDCWRRCSVFNVMVYPKRDSTESLIFPFFKAIFDFSSLQVCEEVASQLRFLQDPAVWVSEALWLHCALISPSLGFNSLCWAACSAYLWHLLPILAFRK